MAVSALPSLFVSISLFSLPESPKFLLCKGREGESLTVMRTIYCANTGRSDQGVELDQWLQLYSRVHENATIEGFITEGEGDFVATFGVNNMPIYMSQCLFRVDRAA